MTGKDLWLDLCGAGETAACQEAKRVSRASKTSKHKTKCQACRWFLGPQKTRRLEVQEAWSKDSRKGLLAGLCGETILRDCVETPHAAHKNKGHWGTTSLWPNYYGSTKEPHNPNIVVGSYRKMGGSVTHTHITNKPWRPRTTRTSRRHPGNMLTSPTIEVKSRCNRLGLHLLGSVSLGKSNRTFTAI